MAYITCSRYVSAKRYSANKPCDNPNQQILTKILLSGAGRAKPPVQAFGGRLRLEKDGLDMLGEKFDLHRVGPRSSIIDDLSIANCIAQQVGLWWEVCGGLVGKPDWFSLLPASKQAPKAENRC
jgi:hypothetical protein